MSHHFEILNSVRVTFWDHCHRTVGFLNFVLLSEHPNRLLAIIDRIRTVEVMHVIQNGPTDGFPASNTIEAAIAHASFIKNLLPSHSSGLSSRSLCGTKLYKIIFKYELWDMIVD